MPVANDESMFPMFIVCRRVEIGIQERYAPELIEPLRKLPAVVGSSVLPSLSTETHLSAHWPLELN